MTVLTFGMVRNMKYNGYYFGVNKFIVCFWDKRRDDWREVVEQFTFNTPISEIKQFAKQLKKDYPREMVKVLKETWQGNDWSDYETIN
jgi:hypothetical protein